MTTKTDAELTKLLAETRATLRVERFAATGARAKDPSQGGTHRKTIARVLTERTARARSAAESHAA